MSSARAVPVLLALLAVVAVTTLLIEPWGSTVGRPEAGTSPETVDRRLEGVAGAGPELATTHGRRPHEKQPEEEALEVPDDVWTIEIAEVVGSDGRPIARADIYIDQSRTVNRTWTWQGQPVRIHMRPWADDAERRRVNERAGYVVCDDSPVYVSVRCEGRATWFAPAQRYEQGGVARLRAMLHPPRTLRGVVLAHDGRRAPDWRCEVVLRPAHVPAEMFALEATVGDDGRFVFDGSEPLPSGPLVVEASAYKQYEDGLPVARAVAHLDEEVVLTLRRAHRFHFALSIKEDAEIDAFVPRLVRLVPSGDAGEDASAHEWYCDVAREPRRMGSVEVLLPEGTQQEWRAAASGYRTEVVSLQASGQERTHLVAVRLEPALESGLLLLDIESPGPRMSGSMSLVLLAPGSQGPWDPWARWQFRAVQRTRAALRLPSGVRRVVRLHVYARPKPAGPPWIIPPFDVILRVGQRLERHVRIVRVATLWVLRKREGGYMPNLHVRLTRGSAERVLNRWVDSRHPSVGRAYLMLGEFEAGTWTVELVRDGKVLPWSEQVSLVAGEDAVVRIPDAVVLPAKER